MIGYVMVGTNDLDKAISFYDEVLKSLNLKRVETDSEYAAYAPMEKSTEIEFYVTKPFNKEKNSECNKFIYKLIPGSEQEIEKLSRTIHQG